ncbi:MAG: MBL fold metallo-hydrolase [Chloroflexaceae bacterium]|nr:MBL fold metallo-hydrolase [Chloroflexaceae bacterium]
MARMILLGVGTGLPDVDRENTHMVWDGPGGPLLIDAGGSTYQRLLRAGIDPQTLRGVLLTHNHTDHINGFPALVFSMALGGRTEPPLPVYGIESTLTTARNILEAFEQEGCAVSVDWRPIEAGDELELGAGWKMHTALTAHARPCLASRFQGPAGEALVYSADTSPCEAVTDLAHGAQVLIHEATVVEPIYGHTTPRQAGEVAAAAGVKRLIMVHFSPRWTMPEAQAVAEVRAGGFTGAAEAGRENQVIELVGNA